MHIPPYLIQNVDGVYKIQIPKILFSYVIKSTYLHSIPRSLIIQKELFFCCVLIFKSYHITKVLRFSCSTFAIYHKTFSYYIQRIDVGT